MARNGWNKSSPRSAASTPRARQTQLWLCELCMCVRVSVWGGEGLCEQHRILRAINVSEMIRKACLKDPYASFSLTHTQEDSRRPEQGQKKAETNNSRSVWKYKCLGSV